MALSPFFTDEELIGQLRLQFTESEMWDMDFRPFLNQVEDLGECYFLRLRGREFFIDRMTGAVTENNPSDDEEEEV